MTRRLSCVVLRANQKVIAAPNVNEFVGTMDKKKHAKLIKVNANENLKKLKILQVLREVTLGNLEAVKKHIEEQEADENWLSKDEDVEFMSFSLRMASSKSQLEIVQYLFESGSELD